MFLVSLRIHHYVIQVRQNKLIHVFLQNLINERLKRSKCVYESKWHYEVLKMAIPTFEGSFPLIACAYAHSIISNNNVNLGIPFCLRKKVK